MMKLCLPILIALFILASLLNWQAYAEDKSMMIKIRFDNNKDVFAVLDDNPTSRDFMSLLPLTIDMRDFAGTEKASDELPKRLKVKENTKGHKPVAGDIAYFAPWGNLAIYYKNEKYHSGIVRMGQIEGDPSVFNTAGSIMLTIERVENE
jgi:hypothetical protein